MKGDRRQRQIAITAAILGATLLLIACAMFLFNGRITNWIEGPSFADLLNRETSKGLKFTAAYGPLHRVGFFGLRADSFSGTNGYKAIVSMEAKDITGTFNPLGIGLRRWEVDDIHIRSGTVTLQETKATPGASHGIPWPPWWALFWPYRVHLQDVQVDTADLVWKLRDQDAGIYHTFLEITPNERDYEYDAKGGDFKSPVSPTMLVNHVHLLIRKPRLYCSDFMLVDDPGHPDQGLRLTGDAGLQDDRSMHLKVDLTSLKVSPWLPEKMRGHVLGNASGHFDYSSSGTGIETGKGSGSIVIANGLLHELAAVHQYVVVTGSPDPGDLALKVCQADLRWDAGALTAENIDVESDGVFHLTGTLTIAADKTLSGQMELGLTDPYLKWLPTARSAIFTRDEGPYHFATIHFSGTSQKPVQDLSPRVAQEVSKSPLLALKLFFNQAGAWFDFE